MYVSLFVLLVFFSLSPNICFNYVSFICDVSAITLLHCALRVRPHNKTPLSGELVCIALQRFNYSLACKNRNNSEMVLIKSDIKRKAYLLRINLIENPIIYYKLLCIIHNLHVAKKLRENRCGTLRRYN